MHHQVQDQVFKTKNIKTNSKNCEMFNLVQFILIIILCTVIKKSILPAST